MFLIKKKVPDDNIKNMKHMTQLPGLPNYLIQAVNHLSIFPVHRIINGKAHLKPRLKASQGPKFTFFINN
jgi:hypothetical protein